MWDSLKNKVYREVRDKLTERALMNKIKIPWEEISLKEVRKSIFSRKKHLRLVVEEGGGHIKHRLK